ncbi:MAG: DUF4332 domain-containing protein [Chloroflexi bacterium]|nr:DUF4332 domain-containing protein [Chloroflexota bacterium]MBU1750399.1 DUF4332 domain-containing protein [Chloroflexota bacterium]
MTATLHIRGIDPVYAQKLDDAGATTVQRLLKRGATPDGRQALEKASGISQDVILQWVNYADLFRIRSIGRQFADLLRAAGVDSISDLAQRNPETLYQELVQVDVEKKLVRQFPSVARVRYWIEQAKRLPVVVIH